MSEELVPGRFSDRTRSGGIKRSRGMKVLRYLDTSSFNRIWDTLHHLDGWLTRDEAEFLYNNAYGTVIEIGSWRGKSTVLLGCAPKVDKVYSIDPHDYDHRDAWKNEDTWTDIQKNITFANRDIILLRGSSFDPEIFKQTESAQTVFIDSNHKDYDIRMNISMYLERLQKGGLLACHDLGGTQYKPLRHLKAEMMASPDYENKGIVDTMWYGTYQGG